MTLGKGTTYSTTNKQKLNTKSSTEAELVTIDDSMGQVLWTRHFLMAQGEPVPTTSIYQDYKSTILLSENGKPSSSQRTWHLDIRYFFVTDKKMQSESHILPYAGHARGFLHEASARNTICTDEIQDTESAQQFKHSCAQECVGAKQKVVGSPGTTKLDTRLNKDQAIIGGGYRK